MKISEIFSQHCRRRQGQGGSRHESHRTGSIASGHEFKRKDRPGIPDFRTASGRGFRRDGAHAGDGSDTGRSVAGRYGAGHMRRRENLQNSKGIYGTSSPSYSADFHAGCHQRVSHGLSDSAGAGGVLPAGALRKMCADGCA